MPELPDPFEVCKVFTPIGHPAVARGIVSRFIGGDSVRGLALDYRVDGVDVEQVIRWALVRLQKRKSIR